VNVRPTNAKLIDRARRVIATASGVDERHAAELLDAAGGSVRAAIVMARLGVDRQEAERRLEASGGRVSEVFRNG